MKLWKCVAIALTLCGAALSVFLSRILLPTKAPVPLHFGLPSSLSLSSLSSLSSSSLSSSSLSSPSSPESSMFSSSSSSRIGRKFRRIRSTNDANGVISEFMHMFQSFTEGELKQVITKLVQQKEERDAKLGKRTKRAKKGSKPCSLQEMQVTVSQLGLGYISDEIIIFRYCSGKCVSSRQNYDMTLAYMKRKRLLTGESRDKARHSPCCRPTAYEDVIGFLNNNNQYQTISNVSALTCGCV